MLTVAFPSSEVIAGASGQTGYHTGPYATRFKPDERLQLMENLQSENSIDRPGGFDHDTASNLEMF